MASKKRAYTLSSFPSSLSIRTDVSAPFVFKGLLDEDDMHRAMYRSQTARNLMTGDNSAPFNPEGKPDPSIFSWWERAASASKGIFGNDCRSNSAPIKQCDS